MRNYIVTGNHSQSHNLTGGLLRIASSIRIHIKKEPCFLWIKTIENRVLQLLQEKYLKYGFATGGYGIRPYDFHCKLTEYE